MRQRLIMTAAVLMLLGVMPTTAAGQEATVGTGNQLIEECPAISSLLDGTTNTTNEFAAYQAGRCQGIVRGVDDMLELYAPRYCAPESSSLGQKIRVVLKHLEDHPAKLHLRDTHLVMAALLVGFPCSD